MTESYEQQLGEARSALRGRGARKGAAISRE